MPKTLEECRSEIDAIDQQIIALFEAHMMVSKDVADYKFHHDMAIFNPEREQQVLENRVALLNDKNYTVLTRTFMQTIMDLSKEVQKRYLETLKIKP